jgi:hypothetical protein
MLTPEYLLHISEGAEKIAGDLHEDIVNRIVKSIMLRLDRGDDYVLTAKDKWMLEVLQDSGVLLEDIQKEIGKKTGLQQTEIKEAMEDACVTNMQYEDALYHAAGIIPGDFTQSPYIMRLMQRTYEATLGEWANFTRTTAEASQRAYIAACDKAYTQVASGAISYTEAVRDAVNAIVGEGVTITYPTGHTDTIETATLRAVRTGVSQASAQITEARMDEYGEDLVLVSAHLGARPEHFVWQGKVYSRSGTNPKYPDFRKSTRYGEVDGLCGANCRHNFSVWFEGAPNPFEQFDAEENQKRYDMEQRQRTMERRIRKTKRETIGLKTARDNAKTPETEAEFDLAYQRKAALLQKQNAVYKDYCEENNLKQLQDRLSVAQWDRKQAAAARGAAKKLVNQAKKYYSGDTNYIIDQYLKHYKHHEIMETHGIKFKRWINYKEALVEIKPCKLKGEKLHAIENRLTKPDRRDMTLEKSQELVNNAKICIFQADRNTVKYMAAEGYAIANLEEDLITSVPQKWRKKYDIYLEDYNEISK